MPSTTAENLPSTTAENLESTTKKSFIKVIVIIAGAFGFISALITCWPTLTQFFNFYYNSSFFPISICLIFIFIFCLIAYNKIKKIIGASNTISISAKLLDSSCKKIDQMYIKSSSVNSNCESVSKRLVDFYKQFNDFGIISIKPRSDYNNDYYVKFYQQTNDKIVISGHSLNTTIDNNNHKDISSAFMQAIKRVLRNGGKVKILLQKLDSDGDTIKRKNFLDFLDELIRQILKECVNWENKETLNDRLLVKEVPVLRYYVVQNENYTQIAHYKLNNFVHNDNKSIFVFDIDPEGIYAKCYIKDFHQVFDGAELVPGSEEFINKLRQV